MGESIKVLETVPRRRSWSRNPLLALCEFGGITLIFWADAHRHIYLSKTLYLFPLAWFSLWLRGLRWTDLGLVRFQNWRKTALVGVLCGVAMELFELFISQPLLMRWTGKAPDLELFRALHGNVTWTLIALAGTWTLAAFGEEMVYRGYLMNRVVDLMRPNRIAWSISLIVVSCVFGASHIDQGITGQLENMVDGLFLGAIYLACRRSLSASIVAHGVADTLDVLLLFFGLYPTLR
ncbi:MAG TPA: type II CAAX endopeptidase family protein [Acidobacteriaceae bacterium]|nr:type II CAAX endopeptidase family protein [Acidobacteriaceae bacterium]